MNSIIHYPDGSTHEPKYGDLILEKAERLLSSKYERPWTVSSVIQWYNMAEEREIRTALLRLLAASRDERAIPFLGAALGDNELDVRVAATYGILDYFMETAIQGGTEQHMMAARKWWQQRKSKYQE
jgi:HEAT repeat protein